MLHIIKKYMSYFYETQKENFLISLHKQAAVLLLTLESREEDNLSYIHLIKHYRGGTLILLLFMYIVLLWHLDTLMRVDYGKTIQGSSAYWCIGCRRDVIKGLHRCMVLP